MALRHRGWWRLAVACAVAGLLAGCARGPAPEGGTAGPVYVVGTEAAYAPFEYVDEKTGQFQGFDIELMEAIAKAAGFRVQWKNMAFDGLIPALLARQIDLAISAMTITDQRSQEVQFSDPYFTAGQVIVVRADNQAIRGPKDLAGRKVGVQAGTTGQFAVEKLEGVRAEDVVKYETTPDAIQALLNGNVEAVVIDLPVAKEFLRNNPDKRLTIVDGPFTVEYYGIAMRKGERELLEKVNRGLAAVKADGTYDRIYAKYFPNP